MFRLTPICLVLLALGCAGNSGPPSVSGTSVSKQKLEDRIRFVESYVKFRRKYNQLEYDFKYQNNGGGRVPGPSDWDIRIAAVVPSSELDDWISADMTKGTAPENDWHKAVAANIDVSSVDEWCRRGSCTIGVDRKHSVVVYRHTTMGQ